jgi:hypothetical protein
MIEFLKKIYESILEIPEFYLGIENKTRAHIFTILFIIIFILIIGILIKMLIQTLKLGKENRDLKTSIDRNILGLLKDDKKKQKVKNNKNSGDI